MAFHGTFEHTLDAKNRLTVPSKFRSTLAGAVFLVKGAEPCLSVYPAETYDAMAQTALAQMNPLSTQKREFSRLFYANAMAMELDGAGRIMLPPRFMIGSSALASEAYEYAEMWMPLATSSYGASKNGLRPIPDCGM